MALLIITKKVLTLCPQKMALILLLYGKNPAKGEIIL